MKAILKPKKGYKIRRPDTKTFLAESGEKIKLDSFWRRRIKDGDVEVLDGNKGGTDKKALNKKDGGKK